MVIILYLSVNIVSFVLYKIFSKKKKPTETKNEMANIPTENFVDLLVYVFTNNTQIIFCVIAYVLTLSIYFYFYNVLKLSKYNFVCFSIYILAFTYNLGECLLRQQFNLLSNLLILYLIYETSNAYFFRSTQIKLVQKDFFELVKNDLNASGKMKILQNDYHYIFNDKHLQKLCDDSFIELGGLTKYSENDFLNQIKRLEFLQLLVSHILKKYNDCINLLKFNFNGFIPITSNFDSSPDSESAQELLNLIIYLIKFLRLRLGGNLRKINRN